MLYYESRDGQAPNFLATNFATDPQISNEKIVAMFQNVCIVSDHLVR